MNINIYKFLLNSKVKKTAIAQKKQEVGRIKGRSGWERMDSKEEYQILSQILKESFKCSSS